MLDIDVWMKDFKDKILSSFGNRVIFIGLQGSYARGEATTESDIDVVVIFDCLSFNDLEKYDTIISSLPYRDKICGFVSGKDELTNWEKSDLFQFYYDTIPIYNNLDFLEHLIKKENIRQAVLIGACNIYHSCCHNTVHEKNFDILQALYKQSVFVLQAKHFYDTGNYIRQRKELLNKLKLKDRAILSNYFAIKSNKIYNITFKQYSNDLFKWSKELINKFHI